MVRVVSCHHFLSQDVFLSQNEPVAFCGAEGKFLVATTEHAVNVHDLDSRGNIFHSFPTIDLVKQITYCESGNYVATIENKASWHRSLITYVRIYFKWWIDVSGQTLKVRIAGCTPTNINSQSWNKTFEMVELPLEQSAIYIACCNKTSALAVSLGNIISVFGYSTKTDEVSKQKFHDFDHFVDISVPIMVKQVEIYENYFACMSENAVHVFKLVSQQDENGFNSSVSETQKDSKLELCDDDCIEWRFESCTYSGAYDKKWEEHIQSKLHSSSFPININFACIDKENEKFCNEESCELYGPLQTIRGCTIDVRLDSKIFEMLPTISSNINAVTLLFKQFVSKENGCSLSGLHLLPFYVAETSPDNFADPLNMAASQSEKSSFSNPWLGLLPVSSSSVRTIGCFFSTPQEGFLYDITNRTQFVSSYVYTSMLKGIAIESSLLHALTDTGLETYTVHLPHSVLSQVEKLDGVKNILPSFDETVCLLGLRPFLGVDHLSMSENHLILISSLEDSVANNVVENANSSTLYSLRKPSVVQVFSDLLEVAESNKSSSPATYYHLLSEAHMILRIEIFMHKTKTKEIESLYRKSCLLLADYFCCSDSYDKTTAVPYYHLSGLSPESVVQRMFDFYHENKHIKILKPMIHYMNSILFDEESGASLTLPQALADGILLSYSEESPEMLWKIILCSNFSGYKIDKAILILKRRLTSKRHPLSPISSAADTTALVYMLILKGSTDAAENMLLSLSKADLVTVLTNVHSKLWNGKTLSVFGKFVKCVRPDAFVELLLNDVDNKTVKVPEILDILQNDSPNVELHKVPLLKEFLEAVLSDKKNMPDVGSSVLTLLVKIYLKRLLESKNCITSNSSSSLSSNMISFASLFGSRPSWLNEMPPFYGKGISRTCMLTSSSGDTSADSCCCWNCNEDLLRLQSLLSYLGSNEDIKGLVLEFLYSAKEKKTDWVSLEVMCSNEAQAIKILIGMSPKALLPYAKENIGNDQKKWCTLFSLLHEHMKRLQDEDPQLEEYAQTFHGVLYHLAETLKPFEFLGLLPQGENPVFLPHVKRCIEKHQADQLKNKIVSLGQEIKSMMLH
ncbi:BLOC-2 complex member HPS3-like [Uloborus diversus]|uniref:BLOC-2 complex member HPS3-like n=1 Tax=Uloborus diversus TaxID=327109 RepID=UPI0024095B49|nr:BLOC-2 complex member HPS3-like [Uloborus diversus]